MNQFTPTEINIINVIRTSLPAKHRSTGTLIYFPQIHILIEKVDDEYIATCLEYSQSFNADQPEESVSGLIQFMYKYFFTMIKDRGVDSLYQQVSSLENENLWSEIRKNNVRKNSDDLEFVSQVQKGNNDRALSNKLKMKYQDHENSEQLQGDENFVFRNSIIAKQNELIARIMKIIQEKDKQLKMQEAEIRNLKYGLEGAEEFEEDLSSMKIEQSSLAY